MDRNLGATQIATSSTDAASYGDLYQWGRGTDGHEKSTSGTTSNLSSTDIPGNVNFILAQSDWRSPQNNTLWQGVNGINNPCPAGFRLPTAAEWTAEKDSWSSNDAKGALASPLKLPMAGGRDFSNGLPMSGHGYYWSYEVDAGNVLFARFLDFTTSNNAYVGATHRAFGLSVRCIKDY
jgi:hypothetical protein